MFGMQRINCTFSQSGSGKMYQAQSMGVGGPCKSCGSTLKCVNRECADCNLGIGKLEIGAKKTSEKSKDEFGWKLKSYTFNNNDFKKETVLTLKIDPDFVAVKLTGIQSMNGFLCMKVKSSSYKEPFLMYVEKSGFLPFSTMKDFLKIDTTEDELKIEVVDQFSQSRQNLQQLIKVLKLQKNKVLPKMLFHLFMPRSYKGTMNFDLCDSTLKGDVVCKFPTFQAIRSNINIDGSSEEHAKFNLNQSRFDGNFQVLKGEAKLKLKDKSSITFYGNPNGKRIKVSGSVKKDSKTYLSENIINNVNYDLTSKKHTIDD